MPMDRPDWAEPATADENLDTIVKAWSERLGLPKEQIRADLERHRERFEAIARARRAARAVVGVQIGQEVDLATMCDFTGAAASAVLRDDAVAAEVGARMERKA